MKRRNLALLLGALAALPALACASGGFRELPKHDAHESPLYAERATWGRYEFAPGGTAEAAAAPGGVAALAPQDPTGTGCDPSWPLVAQADGTTVCEPPGSSTAAPAVVPGSTSPSTTGSTDAIAPIEITAAPPAR